MDVLDNGGGNVDKGGGGWKPKPSLEKCDILMSLKTLLHTF